MTRTAGGSVLITGASGFIGSALVRRFVAGGIAVTATARRPTVELCRELGVEVSHLDVMEPLPPLVGIDTVVHCATPNDIMSRDADGGIPLAVMGTRALIDHAARNGIQRFVYLSTLQVYGTELSGRIDEQTPTNCESLYGLNHYLGEELCRYYATTAGMDVIVVRPANVYGVPAASTVDRWTLVPMCFVREALESGALTLKSSGRQQRNFISTEEVADHIIHLVTDFPPGFNVMNAASEWYCSIADVAGMVEEAWLRARGQPLSVRILSDEPKAGNPFTIDSRWAHLRPTPDSSRQQMIDVIERLLSNQRHSTRTSP